MIRGHTFMTPTKTDQFCAPLQPALGKNEQWIYCSKKMESANTGLISRPPTGPLFPPSVWTS